MRRRSFLATLLMAAVLASPLAAQEKKAEPPMGGYTFDQLVQVMTNLGYEPRVLNASANSGSVQIARTNRTHTLYFAISPDLTHYWLQLIFSIPSLDSADPRAVRRLLEENEKIGPARFGLSSSKAIMFEQPYGNREMTPQKLRKAIDGFCSLFDKEEQFLYASNFLRLSPVAEEIVQPELARLQGEWRVVGGYRNGKPADLEVLKQADIRIVIQGNQMTSKTLPNPLTIHLDPTREPGRIDSEDVKTAIVECGIYKLEGNRLTLHLSNVGTARPVDFNQVDDVTRNVLILEKVN